MLIILLPIMVYAGASVLVEANVNNGWMRIPPEARTTVTFPYIASVPYFYAILAVTLLLLVVGYGVLIIIYSALYRVVGPPRYGPLDAPPPKRSRKKRNIRKRR